MKSNIRIMRTRENAMMPRRATTGSAGLDLCACVENELTIAPGETTMVPTGIAIALENENQVALVFSRSGLSSKHGIALANGVGVIDSDYRGEISVPLHNHSTHPYTIAENERVAQLVVMPIVAVDIQEVDSLESTDRGTAGFGSTGKR